MRVQQKNARDVIRTLLFMTLVWGFLLLLPFATFSSSPVYVAMSAFMSESAWGVYAVFAALAGFYGLGKGYAFWFAASGAMQIVLWVMVGVSLMIANPITTGGPVYIGLALVWASIIRLNRQ